MLKKKQIQLKSEVTKAFIQTLSQKFDNIKEKPKDILNRLDSHSKDASQSAAQGSIKQGAILVKILKSSLDPNDKSNKNKNNEDDEFDDGKTIKSGVTYNSKSRKSS